MLPLLKRIPLERIPVEHTVARRVEVATLKPEPDGYSKARNAQEIAVELLKSVGVAEDQITADMVEAAVRVNADFVSRLEAIRDAAQGTN